MNMKKETKIIIIRHGESLANAKRIYLGHTDWDLSEKGKEQARQVAEYLSDEKIDVIYSSDLIRAYNTALPHAERRGMEIIKSRGLREVYLGEWECRRIEELEAEYPVEFCVGWRERFGTCAVPGGESIPELAERIYGAVYEIAKENEGRTVLIACHAAAIRAFWGKLTETPAEEVAQKIPFPKNASCTTVIFDGERLVPVEYGYDGYFDGGKTAAEA